MKDTLRVILNKILRSFQQNRPSTSRLRKVDARLAHADPARFYRELLAEITADPRYRRNIEYGTPRPGHPEGQIKFHIAELEENLEKLAARFPHTVSAGQYWKLKFLIHVHDTFKPNARSGSRIESPHSHASLARKFAAEYIQDDDLLNMIQYHDVNYALWQQVARTGDYDRQRFQNLLDTILDWDLFLMFIILDGSTQGKERAKLVWFFQEVAKHKTLTLDESWIL